MKARPILFSGAMVRALLAGSKTQTRRIVKLPTKTFSGGPIYERPDMGGWAATAHGGGGAFVVKDGQRVTVPEQAALWHQTTGMCIGCPYGVPGDLLWVRESFTTLNEGSLANPRLLPMYVADWEGFDKPDRDWDWSPSIHMPRWASRLTLEIMDVRVERLQDISSQDAMAEGIARHPQHDQVWMGPATTQLLPYYVARYRDLWNEINGRNAWDANPWVWCVEFRCINKNVDAVSPDLRIAEMR